MYSLIPSCIHYTMENDLIVDANQRWCIICTAQLHVSMSRKRHSSKIFSQNSNSKTYIDIQYIQLSCTCHVQCTCM